MRRCGLASADDGDGLALTFAYPVAQRDWAEERRAASHDAEGAAGLQLCSARATNQRSTLRSSSGRSLMRSRLEKPVTPNL
jgi:hypothetical protein